MTMVDYLDIANVLDMRVNYGGAYGTADRRGQGPYGRKLVSPYMLTTLDGRERRVYVMNYGNSGSAYVIVNGRDLFLDSTTEHAAARMHAAGTTFAEALEHTGAPTDHIIGASSGFVAYWHGGPGYAAPIDGEWFPNIGAAIAEFRERIAGRSHTTRVEFREWTDFPGRFDLYRGARGPLLATPLVEDSSMRLYSATYVTSPFGEPDHDMASYTLEQGPRDGIKVTTWDGPIGNTRYV